MGGKMSTIITCVKVVVETPNAQLFERLSLPVNARVCACVRACVHLYNFIHKVSKFSLIARTFNLQLRYTPKLTVSARDAKRMKIRFNSSIKHE